MIVDELLCIGIFGGGVVFFEIELEGCRVGSVFCGGRLLCFKGLGMVFMVLGLLGDCCFRD